MRKILSILMTTIIVLTMSSAIVVFGYHIKRSMSRAGTPTDNGAMEAINGWIKAELFTDFHIKGDKPIAEEIDEYIKFFNEERPAYALNYLTPRQYKEIYSTV